MSNSTSAQFSTSSANEDAAQIHLAKLDAILKSQCQLSLLEWIEEFSCHAPKEREAADVVQKLKSAGYEDIQSVKQAHEAMSLDDFDVNVLSKKNPFIFTYVAVGETIASLERHKTPADDVYMQQLRLGFQRNIKVSSTDPSPAVK